MNNSTSYNKIAAPDNSGGYRKQDAYCNVVLVLMFHGAKNNRCCMESMVQKNLFDER